jgi:hypothetical protein
MKNEIDKLLQKQMDRKGFIKHVAIGFAAFAGVTTIAKTLSSMNGSDRSQQVATGYGVSAYGGSEARRQSPPRVQL